jgi:N utilization substance protein A
MKNEFTLAFNEVLEDKGLPREIILEALESAMVSAYRKSVNASTEQHIEATVDMETGKVTIFAQKEVVESVENEITEVELSVARQVEPESELGDLVTVESTPSDFGRVAAQTARQVIQQRIRDAERKAQVTYYEKQLGEIVSGIVQAVNASGLTIGLELKTEASMPRKEMIPGERFHIHDRVRALVAEVKDSQRGPQIVLSRTHRDFLRRLLENEVPEIFHGIVEIRSIAREPGDRAKVAVSATQQGIDPVGACVGIRGVRIQAIVKELHDEKIDVIEWNPDPAIFISKAISPARVSGVYLTDQRSSNGKTATVVVPEDQLSLAIGRVGQSERLGAKLTGWRIDIKSLPEAATDALYKLMNDPALVQVRENEQENIPRMEDMLARKTDGKPLTPEEYDLIAKFVDRVERKAIAKTEAQHKEEEEKLTAVRGSIPASSFETSILDAGLPEHVAYLLQEAGYFSAGDLALQFKQDPDVIEKLQGIGIRAMENIRAIVTRLDAQLAEELKAVEVIEVQPVEVVEVTEPVEEIPSTQEVEVLTSEELEQVIETAPVENEVAPVESEEVPEVEPTLEELFTLRPEVLDTTTISEDEDSDESGKGKKKGKKKGKHVVVTYDPDRDTTTVQKKHKRGGGWDWDE